MFCFFLFCLHKAARTRCPLSPMLHRLSTYVSLYFCVCVVVKKCVVNVVNARDYVVNVVNLVNVVIFG